MQRLCVGDQVVVVRGNHKGKRGKVRQVLSERDSVVIEGINIVKKHTRAAPDKPGGILEVEAPLHSSKVMLIDPKTDKPTRVRYQEAEGKKERIAKSGAVIPRGEA